MNHVNFNFYFKVYLLILFLFANFFFFQKYNNLVEWTISEWLINYQGGFTRRGLLGEIAFQLSKFLSITVRETILVLQILTYILFFYLIFNFIKDISKNLIIIFAIFSPLFILYPIAEVEVLGRKEIFVFISFILVANICSLKILQKKHYFYFSLILTICCLIWEGVVIYFSFFIFLFFLQNNFILDKKFILKLFLSLIPFLVCFYLIVLFRLDSESLKNMCDSINECYGAMTYLNRDLSSNISEVSSKFQISYLFRYVIIFLVGFFPLILLIFYSKFDTRIKLKNKNNFSIIFFLVFAPSIIFYYIAQDWGRWIHISYSLSLLTYLFCIKNNIITLDKTRINFSILKNKFIVVFLFILFSFSWSPKTLMNEDVGSIPIYRKSLNIIKSIN